MSAKQHLPTITSATLDGMLASMSKDLQIHDWVAKLCRENPQIVYVLDMLPSESKSSLLVASMVYKMLDSQLEADQMNKDFGLTGDTHE